MIVGKINLAKFMHVITKKKNKAGEEIEGIFIPIEMNHLFKSDKGNIFLDLVAFDAVNEEYKQTHAIKQSLPREVYDAMSEDERKSTPFIGHLNAKPGGGEGEPNTMNDDFTDEGEDDLPF